jgi:IS5 family transposase
VEIITSEIDNVFNRLPGAKPRAFEMKHRRIATPRARVGHVFGVLAQMGGKLVRCMGIVRVTFALHLKAASYNLKRLVFLMEVGLEPF